MVTDVAGATVEKYTHLPPLVLSHTNNVFSEQDYRTSLTVARFANRLYITQWLKPERFLMCYDILIMSYSLFFSWF